MSKLFTFYAFYVVVLLLWCNLFCAANPHKVTFCGEAVPVDNDLVGTKLMTVIRSQMPTANFPRLRQQAVKYFPYIEKWLRQNGIPEDFKYLPIVESGFANRVSSMGARGFWQLLPATAKEFNLKITSSVDERDDPEKSTVVACQVILTNYRVLQNRASAASWTLTAAAYNFGVGNIIRAVQKKGTDYFTMGLNPETADYVYKIIAIKELFENPEIYMNAFGTNVFRNQMQPVAIAVEKKAAPPQRQLNIAVNKDGKPEKARETETSYCVAHLASTYKDFQDGDVIDFVLDHDITLPDGFMSAGSTIGGSAWMIDDRLFVDLGYGHDLQLFSGDMRKGIPLKDVKSGDVSVMIKIETEVR